MDKKYLLEKFYQYGLYIGIKNPILLKMALFDGPYAIRNDSAYDFIKTFGDIKYDSKELLQQS